MRQVSPNSFPQGIIAKGHTEKNFQFLVLSGSALALIQSQLANLLPSQRRSASRALFYFECFLWLIKHPPITSALDLRTNAFLSVQRLFYGALYSTCFLAAEIKYSGRQRLVRYFFKLLAGLSKSAPINIFVHSDFTDSQVRECIVQFESIRIDPVRVAKLTGWHVADRNAGSFRLKMGSVFDVLGPDFTRDLHQESQKHALAHSHYGNYVNVVSRFDDFVRWYDDDPIDRQPLSPEVLQDPMFVYQLFWSFQRWHFEGYSERSQTQPTERVLANLQRQWIRIICWAKSVLVRGGLMCSPLGDVWPEGSKKLTRSLHEVGHHRYADGAANLAMPTKYAIAPIAIWLVAQQPVLTDASLLACELFDRNGKRTGFVRTDSGSVLVVKKNRKGKQQEVVLSDDAASVVELLIQITAPVRRYLKEKGDDAWRRLFIVAGGQGFQEPYTFTSQTSFAKTLRQKAFVQAHSAELGDLVTVLSLARIRATAGVLVYLKSLSIEKMAESLGNSKRVAMNHYLPPTIMQFFQERWVRIFQNAVIVHAMKDSPFLLDATDFNSMSELDRFLEAHALRPFPEEPDPLSISAEQTFDSSDSEIVISIDEGVLGVLLSLKLAVEKAGPRAGETAVYWSEFAAKVESHIESDDFADPYIRSCLVKARGVANPQQFEGLACA